MWVVIHIIISEEEIQAVMYFNRRRGLGGGGVYR